MIDLQSVPPDLTLEELRYLVRSIYAAQAEANARALLAIRVRREVERLHRTGESLKDAFVTVSEDARFPVSSAVVEDIYRQRRAWTAPGL